MECGTAPFTFSVDGGAFGTRPQLTAGTYSVIVMDADSLERPNNGYDKYNETEIPFDPIVEQGDFYACIGDTSVRLKQLVKLVV